MWVSPRKGEQFVTKRAHKTEPAVPGRRTKRTSRMPFMDSFVSPSAVLHQQRRITGLHPAFLSPQYISSWSQFTINAKCNSTLATVPRSLGSNYKQAWKEPDRGAVKWPESPGPAGPDQSNSTIYSHSRSKRSVDSGSTRIDYPSDTEGGREGDAAEQTVRRRRARFTPDALCGAFCHRAARVASRR